MNATVSPVVCYDRYKDAVGIWRGVTTMGQFLEFMKKMVEGKPVFEDENKKDDREAGWNEPDSASGAPVSSTSSIPTGVKESTIVKHQEHTFPVIEVRRVKTHADGTNIQIYCQLENTWNEEIILDKIRLLGTKIELDYHLPAGDVRDFLVYKGPRLRHEDKHAELDYCTSRDKDYFRAELRVKYTYNQEEGTYTLDEMSLDEPIRDIYE